MQNDLLKNSENPGVFSPKNLISKGSFKTLASGLASAGRAKRKQFPVIELGHRMPSSIMELNEDDDIL